MALTIDRLTVSLNIDADTAASILGIMRGTQCPFTVPACNTWRKQCYHEPDTRKPETRMYAIAALLGTQSEAIWGESCTQPVAEYANMGDTYDTTILYDYQRGRYCLTCWGDWVEQYGDRYGVQ